MLSAASSLAWIAAVLGREDEIGELIAGADAFARSPGAVASAPIFLPYLSGERTPHNDAEATGMLAGLRAEHGADALVFAVMEGVAFSFADGVDVLDAAGARPVRPLLVGGGARSEFWGQMIADVTGLTIDLASGAEAGAALGAARLGMLAAGAGSVEAVCPRPPIQREFEPDAERAARPRRAAQALPRPLQGGEGRAALAPPAGQLTPGAPAWIVLAPGRFGLKHPAFEGWKSLDFLGFLVLNECFQWVTLGFLLKKFPRASPGVETQGWEACGRGRLRKGGLLMRRA